MTFVLIILGFLISKVLIEVFVVPKIYTGQPFEDGRTFNKPNWIEFIEATFWLLLSLFEFYRMYSFGWDTELLLYYILMFMLGMIWFVRGIEIWNFRHSEIRLTPKTISVRGHESSAEGEWITLENVQSIYFTRIPTKRLTLSSNATDVAMVVQREGKEAVIINIQSMYLKCYIVAIKSWCKKLYTVVDAPSSSKKQDAPTKREHD